MRPGSRPALTAQHVVDATGGEVVVLGHAGADEPLVVPQIEVGLGAVMGDEHLTVLERAHGARIDVDVRVQFEHRDLQAPRSRMAANEAEAMPFPNEETTPPVTKM